MANNSDNKKDVKNKNSFWKNFKAQLKKVVWPTPKQLVTSTSTVIIMVLVVAFIVFVLDLGFESLNKYGLYQLRDVIISSATKEENTENEESASQEEVSDGTVTIDETEETSEDQITSETEVTEENVISEE